ncbi:hypothetical protein ACJMK2_017034 [Sinanodonta woodiana]|uniref:Rhodanese domain-containing protein n=1 Tax=Sinanodonta woodiana TaxID=1069815 RepID=A0ABD3UYT2_SINWO
MLASDNGMGDRPDTADFEVLKIQQRGSGSPTPSLAVTEGDYGAPPPERTSRSTLQGVIRGVGEVDINKDKSRIPPPEILFETGSPYLLLDIRDRDAYDQCHIITALNYPTAMLSRSVNYETKEMLTHKNQPGKIILIYDEDERSAPSAASTLVERGYDNLFMLSGGMRIAYKSFPEGLFTGTPNQNVTESSKPPAENLPATKKTFDQSDLNNLGLYLDNALSDRSVGSRLSKATTASSRMSGSYSQISVKTTASTGSVSGRPPFKP